MSYYSALSFDSPELIIWSICIGFILGIVITFFVKQVQGKFISLLLGKEACDEGSAVSLCELGQGSNKFLRLCLKIDSGIRGVVTFLEEDIEEDGSKKSKAPNFDKIKFYIAQDKAEKASSMIKGGLKWYFLPVFAILIVIITITVIKLLPMLTSF